MGEALVEVRAVKKHFPVTEGLIFRKRVGAIRAVDGIDFTIPKGGTYGLVGESGCGKSTTAAMILRLEEPTEGTILFEGQDINRLTGADLGRYRSRVQAVFQNPYSSLSPRMRVGDIIAEPLVVNDRRGRKEIRERVAQVLEEVGLQADGARNFPHEFSGGQRQRIAVARALTLNPSLIVLDEPVSALDVSIRAQIINMLQDLQEEFGLTYLLIAHDLAVVKHMSDRVGVMYLGKLAEEAESRELYRNPLHPYTRALYSAALTSRPRRAGEEIVLQGEVPSPLHPPPGCRFHTRCPESMPRCSQEEPLLRDVGGGHRVACHL